MAPNVLNNLNDSYKSKNKEEEKLKYFKKKIKSFQNFIKNNIKYVGENFSYEAIPIHYKPQKKNKVIWQSYKRRAKRIE